MAPEPQRIATWRRAWLRLASAWATVQVERQGKYSVERLYQLHEHERSTSYVRAWTVVLVTPLPCLVAITLLDSVPLESPSLGLEHSHLFWLRTYVMVLIVVTATMVQLREIIPRLPVRNWHVVLVAMTSAAFGAGGGFGLAMWIGFPLPFTIVLGAPPACAAFAASLFLTWSSFLRAHPDVVGELLSFVALTIKQISMTIVYPLFSYVFNNLESYEQTAFALVLPVLKLVFKNWIHASVKQVEDLKPEMIILNAEVFHALYVAYSMQTATSRSTIAVLIAVDFAQACLALRRMTRLAGSWTAAVDSQRSGASASAPSRLSTLVNCCRRHQTNAVAVAPIDTLATAAHDVQLIRFVIHLLETDASILASPDIRAASCSHRWRRPGAPVTSTQVGRLDSPSSLVPIARNAVVPLAVEQPPLAKASALKATSARPSTPKNPRATLCAPDSRVAPMLSEAERRIAAALDRSERRAKVERTLQLLHMTEFAVLVEYTEVIIPVVYCLYLLMMSHLPNRVYYTQLKDLESDQLARNIANILLYAALELVSFLALSWHLRRRLEIPMIRQLAFVLESQWHLVQSKLILWVVFAVQTSLEHFGVDYSFQFQWLRHAS